MLKKEAMFFVLVSLAFLPSVNAITTIASDNFECGGNNCGSGWSGAWGFVGNCDITNLNSPIGGFHLRGAAGGAGECNANRNFDNSGFDFSNISFWAKTDVLEAGEFCRYYYYNGTRHFLLLELNQNNNTYIQYNFSVNSYGLASNAELKMNISANAIGDRCLMDDINITGDSQGGASSFPTVIINSPLNSTLNTSTPRLNLSVGGANIDSVWVSLNNGRTNVTYAHRNGTIDFGYLDLIFADDFGNYINGSDGSPRWINLPQFRTAVVADGRYKLFNETAIIDALAFINDSYFSELDYGGSAKVMVPTGYFGGAYLTPRFADVNNKYEIALDYDFSSLNINRVIVPYDNWSSLGSVWVGPPTPLYDEWRTLGFEIRGNNISALVDGVLKLNFLDNNYPAPNGTGFSLIAFDDTNTHLSYFDDVELHKKLNYGSHTLTVYVNDTSGNLNSSSVTFFVDVDSFPPTFADFVENPANATVYSSGAVYRFNVTITDENSVRSSGIEFNSVNYSVTNISDVYNFSVSNLAAGTYTYYWWANDTSGNYNTSGIRYYTVNRAPQAITSLLNGVNNNLAITYPQQINASFSGINQTAVSIKINSTMINDGRNYSWGAGGWVVNYSAQSNQNYISWTDYLNLTINRAQSSCSLSSNSPATYPAKINVTGNCDNPESNFSLFRNNSDVSSENGALVTLGAGSYSYVVNVSSSQNYTNANASATVIVSQGISEVNLTLNGTEGNITITQGDSILLNGTLITGDSDATLRLYNEGDLINEGTGEVSNQTTFNSAGLFNITVIYISTQNYSQNAETYYVSVTALGNNVSIIALNAPANNSVINGSSAILNASVFDLDLNNMTVWFYGNDVVLDVRYNVTNGTNLIYNWTSLANGNYNWSAVAYDGNANSTREYKLFSVNKSSTVPVVNIFYPSYSSTYRSNASIPLNFSAVSSDLDSCWYSFNGGVTNLSIAGCSNLTFDVSGSGKHNLSVYANETIGNKQGRDSLTFYVDIDDPTVHLVSPTHMNYTNNTFVDFFYIPSSNVSMNNCSLWGDFNGSYILNETDFSITGNAENSFGVNLTDGSYNWAVDCSDAEGSYSITGNRTLNVDMAAPNVTNVTQPSGVQNSGDLEFEYAVSDSSSTTCTFSITATSSGSVVFDNVNSACQNIVVTFNVNVADGSYTSGFVATDSAGNSQNVGSSFSVSTGGGGGPSGGGGSSGGVTGAFSLPIGKRDAQLSIEQSKDLVVKRGTSRNFDLEVTSRDLGFLNACKLRFDGDAGAWFNSEDVTGFSFGENFLYEFEVLVPEDAEIGRHNTNIVVECAEGEKSVNVDLVVFVNDFEIEIGDYERVNNRLRVFYTLQEFSGRNHDIVINYLMSDLDNLPRFRGQDSVNLLASQVLRERIEFELPKDSFGEFDFTVSADNGEIEVSDNKRIFLAFSGRGFLTGLAISDENLRFLSFAGAVILLAILFAVIFYFARRFRRKMRKIKFKKTGRHLFEMEM